MKVFTIAPDFELPDYEGKPTRLAQFKDNKNLILVFLRGFV